MDKYPLGEFDKTTSLLKNKFLVTKVQFLVTSFIFVASA